MMCHWNRNSKMKPIYFNELLYRKVIIDELESNLNDDDEIEEDASVNAEINKGGKISSTNKDEYYLE